MNYRMINEWLKERGIALEEGFAESLCGLAFAFKKTAVHD